jgi:hypothetical protein
MDQYREVIGHIRPLAGVICLYNMIEKDHILSSIAVESKGANGEGISRADTERLLLADTRRASAGYGRTRPGL